MKVITETPHLITQSESLTRRKQLINLIT